MPRANHQRYFSDEELERYARFVENRAQLRPPQCDNGQRCWVRDGPPSFLKAGRNGRCIGCQGHPQSRWRPS